MASERTRDDLYQRTKKLDIKGRSKMNKAQLAAAVERGGGAQTATPPRSRGGAVASPIEVQRFLDGVGYPTRKAELIREAERRGASRDVRATLERIRDEKFDSPADVSEAIGRLA
jgi:hypothetical protein